jgi:hypothetical protein
MAHGFLGPFVRGSVDDARFAVALLIFCRILNRHQETLSDFWGWQRVNVQFQRARN